MIGSRSRLGNEYNINNGYWAGGPPPYGYKLKKISAKSKKSILSISYFEANIVQDIFKKYIQGLSPEKIAEYIKNEYKNNTDRKWTKNSIISILKNEDYTGIMVWDKKGGARNPIKHKKVIKSRQNKNNIIIEQDIWELSKKIRGIQLKEHKFFSTPFLLKGYLVCGKCGNVMKTKNNGRGKGRVYYCYGKEGKLETRLNADFIENKIIEVLGTQLTSTLGSDENLDSFYKKYTTQLNNKKVINEKASAELQEQISENNEYILKCEIQLNEFDENLTYSEDKYDINDNFINSLEELHSYLKINESVLNNKKEEVDKKIQSVILSKETLKNFLLEKKNLLDTIKIKAQDKEIYKRSLKLLLYDLVDKIIYNNENIDIMIK